MSALFFSGIIVGCFMLYIPGYFFLRIANFSKSFSIAVSPMLSLGIASILGISFAYAHYPINPYWLFLGPAFLAAAGYTICLIIKKQKISFSIKREHFIIPLLYLSFSMMIGYALFLHQLPNMESFAQQWDNITHLSLVKNFSLQKICSPFAVTNYLTGSLTPHGVESGVSSFYPVGWHTFTAAILCFLNMDLAESVNLSNFIFGSVVFPLSFYFLLRYLFANNKKALLAGALFIPSFAIFPYRLLVWTPCFPNLAGYSLVPAFALSFMYIFKKDNTPGRRSLFALIFIFCAIGLVLLHPSSIFTTALLMIPFCVHLSYSAGEKYQFKYIKNSKLLFGTICALVCLLIWTALYNLPAASYVTGFNWPANGSPATSFIGALAFSFGLGLTQITLGIIVVIGFIQAIRNKTLRWIGIAFLLTVLQYTITAGSDGPLKQFVAGFWYTDSYRIGGNVMIAAVPLAALGFTWILNKITNYIANQPASLLHTRKKLIPIATTLLIFGMIFFPSFEVNGAFFKNSFTSVTLYDIWRIYDSESPSAIYDQAEQNFAQAAQENNLKNQLIANVPFDGSAFSNPINSTNTLYRAFVLRNETEDSRLIRTQLANIENDTNVLAAAKKLNVGFVILLDSDPNHQEGFQTNSYIEKDWEGITSINENTPGFTLISRSRDCQLYRVDAVAK